ncbi:MAG: hypothetical protein ACD_23C00226G0006 [uncultured bacterium]|nr:MAG: hypothetical protein ACD_23C00226G0006 [uncultured bacterium]
MNQFLRFVLLTLCLALAACGGGGISVVGMGGSGNGSGVGSGGTGITTSAVGIGVVDGFGSVIVNGVRFATDTAQIISEDADSLRLGMTVMVSGTINADLTTGIATTVLSTPEFRGPVTEVDAVAGELALLDSRVSVDEATVYDGFPSLSTIPMGATLQVYALPDGDGSWRATRIEAADASDPLIMSGAIQDLDVASRTFRLGGKVVNYGASSFVGNWVTASLVNGMTIYVRTAAMPVNGVVNAQMIRQGHTLPTTGKFAANLLGIVSNFSSLSSEFVLYGTRVNAASALITGGPSASIGNGVKLEVAGTMADGVLIATRARIRHIPGTGGPASFELIGVVGRYQSIADFLVNGQPVNASGVNVVFINGSPASLRSGARVIVRGSQVMSGVLQAGEIRFE